MTILVVDDTPHMRIQLKAILEAGGFAGILFAQSTEEAFHYLGLSGAGNIYTGIELILMDIIMPGTNGIEACRRIKAHPDSRDIPIIMVTGDSSSESLKAAFEAGANDYIKKPMQSVELIARVNLHLNLRQETAIRRAREHELLGMTKQLEETTIKLQAANESLQHAIDIDGLTGIASRRYFDEFIKREWNGAVRLSRTISASMVDIDFFKNYNDTYGHQRGDTCLKLIATALKDAIKRPLDIVARYGGEEFIALLPDTDKDGAFEVARAMQENVAGLRIPHESSQVNKYVTISIGVAAMTPDRNKEFDALIGFADKALYSAKSKGRNRVEISPDS
ncbi:MAG: diguanylate cyclase [Deltaproteobacteria bacterium]|nr:diguanylate cyclase [Deltaproteobacteria bacterium]